MQMTHLLHSDKELVCLHTHTCTNTTLKELLVFCSMEKCEILIILDY